MEKKQQSNATFLGRIIESPIYLVRPDQYPQMLTKRLEGQEDEEQQEPDNDTDWLEDDMWAAQPKNYDPS